MIFTKKWRVNLMINMKAVGYSFFAGALLYFILAMLTLFPVNSGTNGNDKFIISSLISLATIIPILFYLWACPSNMPLKSLLVFYCILFLCGTVLSYYIYTKLQSFTDYDQLYQFAQTSNKLQTLYNLTIMIVKMLIFWEIIKISRRYSFVWWISIICFIIAFNPLFSITVNMWFPRDSILYMQTVSFIDNISLMLLYVSIGLFLLPKSK